MKLAGISLASNSYCKATETAYLANVTDPRVATLGLTPAMPAIMKYVLVKSNSPEKVRAFMVLAALISGKNKPWVGEGKACSHASFSGNDLAYILIFSAVHVRVERRDAWDSNVLREEVKLWDSVPSCAFGRKHVNQKDFRLDMCRVDVLVTASFKYRQGLCRYQVYACECSQKLAGAGYGSHVD